MIKKNFLHSGAALLGCAALLTLASCQQGKQTQSATAVVASSTEEAQLPIAYVRMDSVLSQYKYAQDVQATLAKDADGHRTRLQGRAAAFQKAAEDFQRRAQINAFISEEAAQKEQAKVIGMQQEVQNLELKLGQELAMKGQLMQEDILKEIQAQIKIFNQDGRYKLVLINSGVLYADESMDITDAFIQHLNAAYKPEMAQASADSVAKKSK